MQNKQYDLTQGSILNKLILVAAPIMGTQLVQMTYNLTDMFWLGRVSSDAVAASGSAGMYLWLGMAFMMIGRMGAEIGVSQFLGRGEEDTARSYAQNALMLSLILGALYGATMVIGRTPLIGFFQIREAHVAKDAMDYLAIVGIAFPFAYLSNTAASIFNGAGNSRTPFIINTVGLVVNMILDPIFILGLDMGIAGAAIATNIGQVIVCLLLLRALSKGKTRPFAQFRLFVRPQRRYVAQIFRWSTPVCIENLLFTSLAMVIARPLAGFGASALAAQRVGSQIESLTWLIGGGFATAITAFVGQNYGAGKWNRIRQGLRVSFLAITAWGLFVTAAMYIGARFLAGLFLQEEATLAMGVSYLRILVFCQLVGNWEPMAIGIFRGLGRTLPPSFVSISGNALRVPLCYWLSSTSLGVDGIWWGLCLGAILRGSCIFLWSILMMRHQPKDDLPYV